MLSVQVLIIKEFYQEIPIINEIHRLLPTGKHRRDPLSMTRALFVMCGVSVLQAGIRYYFTPQIYIGFVSCRVRHTPESTREHETSDQSIPSPLRGELNMMRSALCFEGCTTIVARSAMDGLPGNSIRNLTD
jgi:hypothetical protein